MIKRITASVLWFFATWCVCEMAAFFAGLPRVAPLASTAIALLVGLDPLHRIWTGSGVAKRSMIANPASAAQISGL